MARNPRSTQRKEKRRTLYDGRPEPRCLNKKHRYTLPNGMRVCTVNGRCIRDEIAVDWVGGGNHGAYPWMPPNELWVENLRSPKDVRDIAAHENREYMIMRNGHQPYAKAHRRANKYEALLRKNPKLPISGK